MFRSSRDFGFRYDNAAELLLRDGDNFRVAALLQHGKPRVFRPARPLFARDDVLFASLQTRRRDRRACDQSRAVEFYRRLRRLEFLFTVIHSRARVRISVYSVARV